MVTLAPGLADPVHDAQAQFRDLLHAMSRPGTVVRLRRTLPAPPSPLAAATYALLLGLADHDTALWLDSSSSEVQATLGFHTGARWVENPAKATFAVVAQGKTLPPLDRFAQGEQDDPDRSSTVIVQVDSLRAGRELRLQGPGIQGEAWLCVAGLPENFVEMVEANRRLFPLGVDLVLVAGAEIACLPRTTRLEG